MKLLAKRPFAGSELGIDRHCLDTEACAVQLYAADKRWGEAWRRFFRLSEHGGEVFLLLVRLAALFHDLGKANEEFQRAVLGHRDGHQTIRHEHLSALVLCLPEIRAWLLSGPVRFDLDAVIAAVLSHHLKASEGGERKWGQLHGASNVKLYLAHAQVATCFARAAVLLGIDSAAPVLNIERFSNASPWPEAFDWGTRAGRALRRDKHPERRALVAATKAGLIVADAVASGLVRTGRDIGEWLRQVAEAEPIGAGEVREHVIARRLADIGERIHAKVDLQPFQERTAQVGPRGLLLAACGAGKTLAAWRWAEAQARERAVGRVLFLYPTRGTATEGFRDYVSWAPETTSALVHGTAAYELERMRENPPENRTGNAGRLSESEQRLFALGLWPRRYFSATVDQFLSFLEHRYESLCLLPVLADAAIVVDEVHSFDQRMFDSLVAFLKNFDVPVLCMTATLPQDRTTQLQDCGLRVFPNAREAAELQDLRQKEEAPRYLHRAVLSDDEAFAEAIAAWDQGRRVLWVVNVVARAQALADRLEQALGAPVLCYHSRYRLGDRQKAHEETVKAFQQRGSRAIAVTTQVCEMSLDLDAEVLITEQAPVTSLVQRFGRANRHLANGGRLGELLTYPPKSILPYSKEELGGAAELLAALDSGPVSQARLAQLLQLHAPARPLSRDESSFLESGYYAVPGNFREADDYARRAVLDVDLPAVLAAAKARRPIDGWMLSVPRRHLMEKGEDAAELPDYIGIAPGRCYRPDRGFVVPEE